MQTFLIAFSLAMDAFVVSLSSGISLNNMKNNSIIKEMIKFGVCFGLFQFFMPIGGYFLAGTLKEQIQKFDYLVAFILLNSVGLNMILDKTDGEINNLVPKNNFKNLIALGVATSIDAFAIGASFYALNIHILQASIIIGVVAFIMSCMGIYIGNKVGENLGEGFSKYTEKLGGFILVLIAFKILVMNYV